MLSTVWTILLLVGALGLVLQLVVGGHMGRHGSHNHGGSHSHHTSGRHDSSNHHSPERISGRNLSLLLSLFSPLTFFSVCLGVGATGLLLKHWHLAESIAVIFALIGGTLFYGALIRPLTALILNFASTPSKALEGAIAQPAEVLSHFDSSGKGLVRLTVDGQVVSILATLEDNDRPIASQILPGDRLVVTSIDGRSNACKVARI
jgi:hypothetical protein